MYSLPGVLDVSRVCLALALASRITSTAGPSEDATILSTELMQNSCHVLPLGKVCCMTVGWLRMLRLLHIAAYTIRPSRTNNQLAALYVTLHRMGRFDASRPTATSQRSAASRPHLALQRPSLSGSPASAPPSAPGRPYAAPWRTVASADSIQCRGQPVSLTRVTTALQCAQHGRPLTALQGCSLMAQGARGTRALSTAVTPGADLMIRPRLAAEPARVDGRHLLHLPDEAHKRLSMSNAGSWASNDGLRSMLHLHRLLQSGPPTHSIISMQQLSAALCVRHGHALSKLATQRAVYLPDPVNPLGLAFLQRPQVRLDGIGPRHPPCISIFSSKLVSAPSRKPTNMSTEP